MEPLNMGINLDFHVLGRAHQLSVIWLLDWRVTHTTILCVYVSVLSPCTSLSQRNSCLKTLWVGQRWFQSMFEVWFCVIKKKSHPVHVNPVLWMNSPLQLARHTVCIFVSSFTRQSPTICVRSWQGEMDFAKGTALSLKKGRKVWLLGISLNSCAALWRTA